MTAAPLKLWLLRKRGGENAAPLRGHMTAAPLKHLGAVPSNAGTAPSPRSHDRGPIEAAGMVLIPVSMYRLSEVGRPKPSYVQKVSIPLGPIPRE